MHFVLFGWLHCCIDNLGIEFTFCRHLIFFLFDFIHFQELKGKKRQKIWLIISDIHSNVGAFHSDGSRTKREARNKNKKIVRDFMGL